MIELNFKIDKGVVTTTSTYDYKLFGIKAKGTQTAEAKIEEVIVAYTKVLASIVEDPTGLATIKIVADEIGIDIVSLIAALSNAVGSADDKAGVQELIKKWKTNAKAEIKLDKKMGVK